MACQRPVSVPQRLRLVDLTTGEIRADVPLDPGYATLAVAPVFLTHRGRPVVAVAGTDVPGPIVLFDAATGERQDTTFSLDSGTASVLATGRIEGREVLAAGGDFDGVRIWDADTGAQLLNLTPEGFRVRAIALGERHGRPVVATATEQYGRVQVFDAINGQPVGRAVDIGRRWPPLVVTSLRVTRFRDDTAVLAAPPRLWIV
ncbi:MULTISPECIES: WD40 repeat domain-containing protein [Catenuloplanes]|uniref:WD40 repeat domain-containing protein n=1 Tax=Catenuloplanes niger TaxID=587534 RepID=A0AAE3ZKT9_9ACTN|nr:WD40 repeat domain-containing protein [Catenuloplanes niger]MDR7320465.1 hypothetical protein [Catenuloplanes niger]